ncbi:Protein sine oculis [Thelohanellus kitauei]|uniref:Protein sine oculis n=1 Tax=Thelohanellus kitauei TaxID=669202 RepID=A0A0C2JM33_THEKT|nr:Protein sine oculis [Thelohanellus kitauei]
MEKQPYDKYPPDLYYVFQTYPEDGYQAQDSKDFSDFGDIKGVDCEHSDMSQIQSSNVNFKRKRSRNNAKVHHLQLWYNNNSTNPFPSKAEKSNLAKLAGMTELQVSNWFSNRRRKDREIAKSISIQNFNKDLQAEQLRLDRNNGLCTSNDHILTYRANSMKQSGVDELSKS